MKVLIIVITIIALCMIGGYFTRGAYWRHQPVKHHSLFGQIDGQLKQPQDVDTDSLQLPKDGGERWIDSLTSNVLQAFLKDNYPTMYSKLYIEWILDKTCCTIGLTDSNGILIGTITGRLLTLDLDGTIKNGFYVDFLCVRKDLRHKGYAPHLINRLIANWKQSMLDICIFYKDTKPLPIQSIGTLNYWGSSINSCTQIPSGYIFIPMTESNRLASFIFFTTYMKTFKIHSNMNATQFNHYFMPQDMIVYTYVLYHNNIIVGLSNYVIEDDQKNIKIVYHISCMSRQKDHNIIFMSQLLQNNVHTFYLLDIEPHMSFIRSTKAKRLDKTYFHLYNYFINAKSSDIAYSPH